MAFTPEKYRVAQGRRQLAAAYMARPFGWGGSVRNVLIAHHPKRISYSQIYPFFHYARGFRARYGVRFRAVPFNDLLTRGKGLLGRADTLLLQPWFTATPDEVRAACAAARAANPNMAISFLDSYAHNDLRMARHLPETLQFYVKKSLFKAPRDYLKAYRGDTNLNEYYSDLAGLSAEPVEFNVPEAILPKLRLCPNFFTAPHLIETFDAAAPPPQEGRHLDVQSRLRADGSPWYNAMRRNAIDAINVVEGISISPEGKLGFDAFMEEMRAAKLCFSPFGYGELCWRDIEAIQAGAVMVKQSMNHLDTKPDLYEAGETYLPVKWDCSDLEEVLRGALEDDALRHRIAQTAYRRIADYIQQERFVDDMGFLFAPEA